MWSQVCTWMENSNKKDSTYLIKKPTERPTPEVREHCKVPAKKKKKFLPTNKQHVQLPHSKLFEKIISFQGKNIPLLSGGFFPHCLNYSQVSLIGSSWSGVIRWYLSQHYLWIKVVPRKRAANIQDLFSLFSV